MQCKAPTHDYAKIRGLSGEIVKLWMIVEKKPGILNLWKALWVAGIE